MFHASSPKAPAIRFALALFAGAAATLLTTAAHAQTVSGFSNFVLNGNATVSSNVLTLTSATATNTSSAYYNATISYATDFQASFVYTCINTSDGDGGSFILQNQGLTALGGAGGANLGLAGITPSAAITWQIRQGNFTGFVQDGSFTGEVASQPSPINLASGHPILENINYSSSDTITEILTDETTNKTYSTSYSSNLSTLLGGGGSAYVGFTGADGAALLNQTVSNFTIHSGSAAPEPTVLLLRGPGLLGMVAARRSSRRNAA